jgi:hypothetical protein
VDERIIKGVKVSDNRVYFAKPLRTFLGKDVFVVGQGDSFYLFGSANFEYYEILLKLSCSR